MASAALAERVRQASGRAPLSQLSGAQRAELERELELADALEDLPGWWQAAVLEAELGPAAGATAGGRACH